MRRESFERAKKPYDLMRRKFYMYLKRSQSFVCSAALVVVRQRHKRTAAERKRIKNNKKKNVTQNIHGKEEIWCGPLRRCTQNDDGVISYQFIKNTNTVKGERNEIAQTRQCGCTQCLKNILARHIEWMETQASHTG